MRPAAVLSLLVFAGCGVPLAQVPERGLALEVGGGGYAASVSLWGHAATCQVIAPVTAKLNGLTLQEFSAGGETGFFDPPGCRAKELTLPLETTLDLTALHLEVEQGGTVLVLDTVDVCAKRVVTVVSPADKVLRPGTAAVLAWSHPLDVLILTSVIVEGVTIPAQVVGAEIRFTLPTPFAHSGPTSIAFARDDFEEAAQCSGVESCKATCGASLPDPLVVTLAP